MNAIQILVADDDSAMAIAISMRLEHLGFKVMRSPDAMHALYGAHRFHPDLIILDINMPGGNGLAVCEMLASDPELSKIPVILHSGCSDEPTTRRARELGARFIVKRPGSWTQIKADVLELLEIDAAPESDSEVNNRTWPEPRADLLLPAGYDERRRPSSTTTQPISDSTAMLSPNQQHESLSQAAEERPSTVVNSAAYERSARVLCIDDDLDFGNALKIRLEGFGYTVLSAANGEQGMHIAISESPDAIIADLVLPEGEGVYILRQLKSHEASKQIPVIVLTGQGYEAVRRQVMQSGAAAYLNKPPNFPELLHTLRLNIETPQASPVMS